MTEPNNFPNNYPTDPNTRWFEKPFPRFRIESTIQARAHARFRECAYVQQFELTLEAGEELDCFYYPPEHRRIAFFHPVNRVALEARFLPIEIRNHCDYAGFYIVLGKDCITENCTLIESGQDPIAPEKQEPNLKGTHKKGWFMIQQEELGNALKAAQQINKNPVCFHYSNDGIAHTFKIAPKRDTNLIDITNYTHW